MAYRSAAVFEQAFTASSSITVTHNSGLEFLNIRVLIGNDPSPDLIRRVMTNPSDPLNELTVDLVSSQTGVIQLFEADTYAVGASPNTMQYQSLTFGQHYTYTESLGTTANATAVYVTKLTLTTPTVEAGDYHIGWNFTWNISNAGGDFDAIIDQDAGTTLWTMMESASGIGANILQPASGFAEITLTAAIHTFDLEFRRALAGTAEVSQARMGFWRVM